MDPQVSQRLKTAHDLPELESAIRALCEPLGKVRRVDVIPHTEAGCILCRIEPDSPGDHDAFVDQFGGVFLGRGVYFNIPDSLTPAALHR